MARADLPVKAAAGGPVAGERFRLDIQGLRAVAVGAVLLFHLWPNRVPGGFVGVDVFFVISGFLITGHLLREVTATGTVNLPRFWSRRVARLLPDAFLVLAATMVATFLLVPRAVWGDYFSQIRASALYFENWQLAWDAVDYMAIGADATAVQHYWSLSVEEQFYLVWPVLIVVALMVVAWLSRRANASAFSGNGSLPRRVILALMSAILVASLTYSVFKTSVDSAWAFFSSFTRAWEFALGGIVALTVPLVSRVFRDSLAAALLAWVGLIMVVTAAMAYSEQTPFPGYAALLPTVGTSMLLAFGDGASRFGVRALLSWRPMVWLGGVSYAVYLWHWPLIILTPFATHTPLTMWQKVAIGAVTLVLAQLSTRFIEDPLRRGRPLARPGRAFTFAAVGGLVFVLCVAGAQWSLNREAARQSSLVAERVGDPCVGPGALDPNNRCSSIMGDGPYLVSPEVVALQNKGAELGECQQNGKVADVRTCQIGAAGEAAKFEVIVAGDSHATQWFPGFEEAGTRDGWRVTTFSKSGCPVSMSSRVLDVEETTDNRESCDQWVDDVIEQIIDSDADVVVLTSYQSAYEWDQKVDGSGTEDPVEGFAQAMEAIADSGKKVVVIKAVPRTNGTYVATCLEKNGRSLEQCGVSREEGLPPDLMEQAVEHLDRPDVTLVDLDDQFCDEDWCYPVVGDVVVYRDYSHISAEWSRLLAPFIMTEVESR